MHPRYQKSGSVSLQIHEFRDLPVRRLVCAKVCNPVAAACSSTASPDSAIPMAQTAASRPKMAV